MAQLVARQRSSKRKVGRQVNCQMRLKSTSPVTLPGKPQAAAECLPLGQNCAAAIAKVLAVRLV